MVGVNNWERNFGMIQLNFLSMLVQPITVVSSITVRISEKVYYHHMTD